MEYCDEGTIAEVAKAGLPEDMIRRYTREITIAVSVLHESGIVHRDIKGKIKCQCHGQGLFSQSCMLHPWQRQNENSITNAHWIVSSNGIQARKM